MSTLNYILNEDDEKLLTREELQRHADYSGDADTRLLLRAMSRKLLSQINPHLEKAKLLEWLDLPASELHFSARIQNVILNNNYQTIRDVYEAGSDRLMRHDNFGARCRHDLEEVFKDHGLIWRSECHEAPKIIDVNVKVDMTSSVRTFPLSAKLLTDLVDAAHHNLAHYERQYGRFASRGKQKAEHDRLKALVLDAEDLLKKAGIT